MRQHPDAICRNCGDLYSEHVFRDNRRRCVKGLPRASNLAFKPWYWTQEEIDAATKRGDEMAAEFRKYDP